MDIIAKWRLPRADKMNEKLENQAQEWPDQGNPGFSMRKDGMGSSSLVWLCHCRGEKHGILFLSVSLASD